MSKLRNKSFNRSNGALSQFANTVDDGLFGHRPVLLERYLNNGLRFHLHFRLRLSEFDTQYFCAVLGGPSRPFRLREADKFQGSLALAAQSNGIDASIRNKNHEQSMFVGHIHAMQDPERVPIKTFRAMVRLKRFDNVCCDAGDALYFSPLTGFFKFIQCLTDWEFMPMVGRPIVRNHKLSNEVIQRGAILMNNLASNDRETKGRIWPDNAQDLLSRITIRLTNNAIDVAIKKSGNLIVEIIDMLVGPLNFCPNAVKGVGHGRDSEDSEGRRNTNPKRGAFFKNLKKAATPSAPRRKKK